MNKKNKSLSKVQDKPANFIKKIRLNQTKSKSFQFIPKINQQTLTSLSYKSINIKPHSFSQINKNDLPNFIVLGMLRKQIFCIYNPQLNLYATVDQHAMHQRIRYQYYCNILQGKDVRNFLQHNIQKNVHKSKTKVFGPKKQFKLIYICKLQSQCKIKCIQKYGIKLMVEQNGDVYMHYCTQILGKLFPDQILIQICKQIIELQLTKSNRFSATLDQFVAEYSCKNAIKFGDQISRQWCQDLLHNASQCTFPWKCVHGRPTIHFQWYNYNQANINYTLQ